VVEDGQAAVDYLGGENTFSDREKYPFPDVVLLDLKLPHIPGLDVLATVRGPLAFRTLPVVVLTSSRQESDIVTAYQRGASAFVVKPTSTEQRADFVRHLIGFWLKFNEPAPLDRQS
jgi:CheY-like chemotaxis protein